MTFILLVVLIVIAMIFRLIKWQRFSFTLYVITFVLFIAIGIGVLPRYLLTNLQSPPELAHISWGKKNAIILLGAGTEKIPDSSDIEVGSFAYGRLAKTAALYSFCRVVSEQCKVIVSGGDPQHHGAAEAVIYGAYLQELGVDKTDLLLEKCSKNTWQNAQFTAPLTTSLFKQHNSYPGDNIVLVTSGIHMRRSLLYFSHFGINAQPARADYLSAKTTWFPLAYNFLVTDLALNEYVGLWRYQLYNQLGWNVGK
ncbi:MAG TPA: YdcF family protein [Herbaspirillum sp.]|jgi:uncharacterized SAM-binding protein YcdF (DUF218 family)|nr:YdcF family protein [Herbaspirillum sp.]